MLTNIAGIAMYSSIKKAKARPGDWLAIIGAGGGLGHLYGRNLALKSFFLKSSR